MSIFKLRMAINPYRPHSNLNSLTQAKFAWSGHSKKSSKKRICRKRTTLNCFFTWKPILNWLMIFAREATTHCTNMIYGETCLKRYKNLMRPWMRLNLAWKMLRSSRRLRVRLWNQQLVMLRWKSWSGNCLKNLKLWRGQWKKNVFMTFYQLKIKQN